MFVLAKACLAKEETEGWGTVRPESNEMHKQQTRTSAKIGLGSKFGQSGKSPAGRSERAVVRGMMGK